MSLEGQGNLGVGKKAENNIIFEIIFLLFFYLFICNNVIAYKMPLNVSV